MYRCDMFNEMEICKWECKDDANKAWALAKTYFEILFTENETFEDGMGAGKSGFEIANNDGELRSRGLPFDNRSFCGSTNGSMPSLGDGTGGQLVQGAAQEDEA